MSTGSELNAPDGPVRPLFDDAARIIAIVENRDPGAQERQNRWVYGSVQHVGEAMLGLIGHADIMNEIIIALQGVSEMRELRTVWSILNAYSRGLIAQGAAMRALHLRPGEEEVLRAAMLEAGHDLPRAIIGPIQDRPDDR